MSLSSFPKLLQFWSSTLSAFNHVPDYTGFMSASHFYLKRSKQLEVRLLEVRSHAFKNNILSAYCVLNTGYTAVKKTKYPPSRNTFYSRQTTNK